MGMRAIYRAITDKELANVIKRTDGENWGEIKDDEVCDIDKMWDALHFLLTGRSAMEVGMVAAEDELISQAILGHQMLSGEDVEEFTAGSDSNKVKEIAIALEKLDFEEYMEMFNMVNFAENEIYPDIWEYEDEEDEIKEDLECCFENLRDFYARMSERGLGVYISIC